MNLDTNSAYQDALNDLDVQKFLAQNKVTKENVQKSLPDIYEYVREKNNFQQGHPAIPGYEPTLKMNGNLITVSYAPTAKTMANQEQRQAKQRLELIDIAPSFRNIELSDANQDKGRMNALAQIAVFMQKIEKHKPAKGLYLAGDFGVGKTYLLAGLANALAKAHKHVVFLHVPTFIAGLSKHFDDNSLQDEIMHIAQSDVVIFDDIGAETLSPWSRDDVLGVILQHRMDNNLPTFFSSNMSMKELTDHFAQTKNAVEDVKAKRLMQRVKFLSQEVVVGGKNWRESM